MFPTGHDDEVLEPATHHDIAGFGEIAQIAGVVPALLILGGDEAGRRGVTLGHRLTAHLDDADATRRQEAAVLVDDAHLQSAQRSAERRQSPGASLGRRDGAVQDGQHVGVHLVDDHAAVALGERHRHRRLGHTVGRDDRLRPQPERRARVAQILHVKRVDLLGAGQRPSKRRQVVLAGGGLPA